jgi:hypothetical protein
MKLYFTYLNGPEQGKSVKIEDFPASIGSKVGQSVLLNDSDAPFHACKLEKIGENVFLSVTVKKKNTVSFNGQNLEIEQKRKLCSGDVIEVGNSILLVGVNHPLKKFLKEMAING